MRWISKSEFKSMPWKNGLGVTSEIEVFPKDADFSSGQFLWRLSSARVAATNQFSQFPGFDRLLTVTEGEGLLLNGQPLRQGQVHSFSGEELIHCKLLGQPVEDLGLIYRRDQVQARMEILPLTRPLDLHVTSDVQFIKVLHGELRFQNQTLNSSDILRLEKNENFLLNPINLGTQVVIIKIK
jgi:environmental stress-induced protein Ves